MLWDASNKNRMRVVGFDFSFSFVCENETTGSARIARKIIICEIVFFKKPSSIN
jgi:hypothetical protein